MTVEMAVACGDRKRGPPGHPRRAHPRTAGGRLRVHVRQLRRRRGRGGRAAPVDGRRRRPGARAPRPVRSIDALACWASSRIAVATPVRRSRSPTGSWRSSPSTASTVVACEGLGLLGNIWRVRLRRRSSQIVNAVDHADAEALFISCTNLPTYDLIEAARSSARQAGAHRQPGHDVGRAARDRSRRRGRRVATESRRARRIRTPGLTPASSRHDSTRRHPLPRATRAEDDYPLAERLLARPVRGCAAVVHTEMREDAHRVDALLDIGGDDVLADGRRELRRPGAARRGRLGLHERAASCSAGTARRQQVAGRSRRSRGARVEHVVRVRRRVRAPRAAAGSPSAATYPDGRRGAVRGVPRPAGRRGRSRCRRRGSSPRPRSARSAATRCWSSSRPTTTPTPRRCCCPTPRCTRSALLDELEDARRQAGAHREPGQRVAGAAPRRPSRRALPARPGSSARAVPASRSAMRGRDAVVSELGELEPVARQSTAELIADRAAVGDHVRGTSRRAHSWARWSWPRASA